MKKNKMVSQKLKSWRRVIDLALKHCLEHMHRTPRVPGFESHLHMSFHLPGNVSLGWQQAIIQVAETLPLMGEAWDEFLTHDFSWPHSDCGSHLRQDILDG